MMRNPNVVALLSGLLFGAGLALSGMVNPVKVLDFFDISGQWDPSLMFVMGGAVSVMAVCYWLVGKRSSAACGGTFQIPERKDITPQLIIGALMFGTGWGLAGICPGPALLGLLQVKVSFFVYFAAVVLGMLLYKWLPWKA
jgi:uncharacterized membrane protein YedE/YeeE